MEYWHDYEWRKEQKEINCRLKMVILVKNGKVELNEVKRM